MTVEQSEIDAPGIDAYAFEPPVPYMSGLAERRLDFGPETEYVPVEAALELDRAVRKTVQLTKLEPLTLELPKHYATARGSQIYRYKRRHGSTNRARR